MQCMHGMRCMHVHIFLSDFVSIENKGAKILLPKLEVAGSNPVARSLNRHKKFKSAKVVKEKG